LTRARIAVGCAVLAVTLAVFVFRISRDMRDFEVPYTVAIRAAAATPLYRAEDEHYQFKYLPAFAVLAIPLGLMPLSVAKGVWFVGSVGLLIALIVLSVRLLPEQRKSTTVLVVSAIIVLAKFYGRELDLGQVNLAFAAAAAAAFLAMKNGRDVLAALLLVLTIAIKPYGALLLPALLVRRHKAATVTAGIGVLLLLALPVPLYGWAGTFDLHETWWKVVTETTAPNLMNPDNVSLASMYAKWLGMGALAAALAALSGLLLLGGVGLVFLKRGRVASPEALEGSLLLLLIPLLSPQGWDYVLLIATPAIMCLANYQDLLPAPWRTLTITAALVIGLSLFDIMGRANYAAFMGAAVISVCALVLVGALLTLRLRSIA
jgi:hypothetical protein